MSQADEYKGRVDVGIITIRPDEFEAVLRHLPVHRWVEGKGSYGICVLETTQPDKKLVIAVTRCSQQGNTESQSVARDMIDDLDPQWLSLVGIGAGVASDDYTLGDVVIASRVNDYTVSADKSKSPEEFAVAGGPMHPDITRKLKTLPGRHCELGAWNLEASIGKPSPRIKATAQNAYGDKNTKTKVIESLKKHFRLGEKSRIPKFLVGPVASADRLVKNSKTLETWRRTARNLAAIEMELTGVYRAARSGDREYPILAVRGISDIVGFNRDDDWTAYACLVAGSFVIAFLKMAPLSPRNSNSEIDVLFDLNRVQIDDKRVAFPVKVRGFSLSEFCEYDFDLGTAWGLEEGSSINFLINPTMIPITEELKSFEKTFESSLTSSEKLVGRTWLQIDALENDFNREFDSLPAANNLGIIIEVKKEQLGVFANIITLWREWLETYKAKRQISLVFCLEANRNEGENFIKSVIHLFDENILNDFSLNYATVLTYPSFLTRRAEIFPLSEESGSLELYRWYKHGVENRRRNSEAVFSEQQYGLLADTALRSSISSDDDDGDRSSLSPDLVVQDLDKRDFDDCGIDKQLVDFTENFLPQYLPVLINAYSSSKRRDARHFSLVFSASSDSLMDAWVRGNIGYPDYYPEIVDLAPENGVSVLEAYVLALLRLLKASSSTVNILRILRSLNSYMPSHLQWLCQYRISRLEAKDIPASFPFERLSVIDRAGIQLYWNASWLDQFFISNTAVWRELAYFPVRNENVSASLEMDSKRRSVMGLCTEQEWRDIRKDTEAIRQILLCRNGHSLKYRSIE